MVKHIEELKETAFFLGTLGHGTRDRNEEDNSGNKSEDYLQPR